MYPIIKEYLINQGYDVKAEVMQADIVAKKDDVMIIIEMKVSLTTSLIYQGLKRMHLCDDVYLAIPKPSAKGLKSSTFHEKETIVRRLEMGLMLVDTKQERIDILFDPAHYQLKRHHQKKNRLLKEFSLRQTRLNVGGVTRTKIITAYKELTLLIMDEMRDGPKTTSYLREVLGRKKVTDILQKNYNGWFERIRRGVYRLTPKGEEALKGYQDIIVEIKQTIKQKENLIIQE